MEFSDYRRYDGLGLAELVARREVTAAELLETAIARLDRIDPVLNTVVCRLDDRARAKAKEPPTGPFGGVPFLVKDLGQNLAGIPDGRGNRALATVPAPSNSEIVDRWLTSGVVIFGKTNTPEFGAKNITEPEVNGPTRNPWDTALTPGGSSGGAAAAVAAGVVPVAGASDGGGSIRIPAACCGLFGLKPGRGLVPTGPPGGEALHGAGTNGVLTRSVRDAAAMLDVMTGGGPAAPYEVTVPSGTYAAAVREPIRRLRIGFATGSPVGTGVGSDAIAAVEDAAAVLDGLGHTVEPAETGIDERALAADFLTMWFAMLSAEVREVRHLTGAGAEAFEFDTLMLAELGRSISGADYVASLNRWRDHVVALSKFHSRYDLLLTPTLAFPPARVGELVTPAWMRLVGSALVKTKLGRVARWSGVVDSVIDDNLGRTPYTQLANVTGRPAMSVPLYWTERKIPLGVQFVAPLGGESLLLSLAAELEQARPWFDRVPDFLRDAR